MKIVTTKHTTKKDSLKFERTLFNTRLEFTKNYYIIGSYTSEKPVNNNGLDEFFLKVFVILEVL